MSDSTSYSGGTSNSPPFPPSDVDADPTQARGTVDQGTAKAPNAATSVPGRLGEEVMRRVESGIQRGLGHFAEQLDDTAHQLHGLASERLEELGPRGARAADSAEVFAGKLSNFAEYLRTSELDGLQRDLTTHFRVEPAKTLVLSIGAGWLLGKILR